MKVQQTGHLNASAEVSHRSSVQKNVDTQQNQQNQQPNQKAQMAEIRTENFQDYKALLKIQKPNVALRYMKLALKNEVETKQPLHSKAIKYVESAIDDYRNVLHQIKNGVSFTNGQTELTVAHMLQFLSIAYYNLGVEHEHMKNYNNAIDNFEIALENCLNSTQGNLLSQQIHQALSEVRTKHEQAQSVHDRRINLRQTNRTMKFFKDQTHLFAIDTTRQERFKKQLSFLKQSSQQSRDHLEEVVIQSQKLQKKYQQETYQRFLQKNTQKANQSQDSHREKDYIFKQNKDLELPSTRGSYFRGTSNHTPMHGLITQYPTSKASQRTKTANTTQFRMSEMSSSQMNHKPVELITQMNRYGLMSPSDAPQIDFEKFRKSLQMNNYKQEKDQVNQMDIKRKDIMSQSVKRTSIYSFDKQNQKIKSQFEHNEENNAQGDDGEVIHGSKREIKTTAKQSRKPTMNKTFYSQVNKRALNDSGLAQPNFNGQVDNSDILSAGEKQHKLLSKPQFVQNQVLKKHYQKYKMNFNEILVNKGAAHQRSFMDDGIGQEQLTQSQFKDPNQSFEENLAKIKNRNYYSKHFTNQKEDPIYKRLSIGSPPDYDYYKIQDLNKYILAQSVVQGNQVA
ncbi:tpr domain containing protein [Stylonychia lemnae]|uniref:Tpr domain containing protein n=1 Tax=Stylonychia lemnae TaxID=5949 RepID=A0A077ZPZ4_STYLE|nr:tpr domain containing protein [Stylonychia lemnae]|eukprot:CDW72007.1 tpr domain containing protein [Stylonychia lemnae]